MNSVTFFINKTKYTWLVDTGASLSAIKKNIALQTSEHITPHTIYINGIGGQIISDGYIQLNLETMNKTKIRHKFYVFDKLPSHIDGIIGQDFLVKYKCQLNYENNSLTLNDKNTTLTLPLQLYSIKKNNIQSNEIKLAPRCETVVKIPTNILEESVVLSNEICEGIFIANTVISNNDGFFSVKILNTKETEVVLKNFTPEIVPLNNFHCLSFNKCEKTGSRVKQLFDLLKLNYLNSEEKHSIGHICAKYADIFHLPGDELTCTNLYEQKIHLKPNISPVYSKPYRLPQSQKTEIGKQIKEMLENDIIEESQSEWSSPILLVPKKADANGEKKWRLVIDYRKVNECIQNDKFPLPNVNEIFDSLAGSVYFSTLDLNQSYYQIKLEPGSRKYTAFIADRHYQMKRLPMGLKTSPSAFSRAITIAMSGLNYLKCIVYLDDVIIMGRNLNEHNKNLMDVFARLRKVNLKLNPLKCKFLQKETLYLGHVVTSEGIKPDPNKVTAIVNYPVPTTTDDVRRFVAFANYYRKFIKNFSEITIPLNKLLKKDSPFVWGDECKMAFEKLKTAIMSPPVLQYPDFSEKNEFIIHTDASNIAIGCVLSNNDGLPVAYASRPLNKAEKNYPTIEKELLAIVWAVKHFRPYLFGRKFKIMTDHRPLVYLFNMNNPSSRLTKFRLCLEEYDFTVTYLKGQNNVAADALSRIEITIDELKNVNKHVMSVMTRAQQKKIVKPINGNTFDSGVPNSDLGSPPKVIEILRKPTNLPELTFNEKNYEKTLLKQDIIHSQNKIFVYSPKKQVLCVNPNSRSCLKRAFFVRELDSFCETLHIQELCIIRNKENEDIIKALMQYVSQCEERKGPRLCILRGVKRINNTDDKFIILNDYHLLPTSGHAGIQRMINNIKQHYYWPGMYQDIHKFVSSCDKCQKQKYKTHTKQPMCITSTATSAFEKVFLDLVGPLTKDANGYCYILTLQCELTKYVEAYPLLNKESETVARAFVDNFILHYGIPREVGTDRGSEFISSTMRDVCKILNIHQLQSTAYHHETLGSLENSHKSLGAFLRIQTNNQAHQWSDWLQYWCFSYNTTVHTSTKYTPFELVFGKKCSIPTNIIQTVDPVYNYSSYPVELKYRLQKSQEDARNNLIKSKEVRKSIYDKKINPTTYNVGDLLLVRKEDRGKMDPIYTGPYTVIEDLDVNVKILILGKEYILHKNRTIPYHLGTK